MRLKPFFSAVLLADPSLIQCVVWRCAVYAARPARVTQRSRHYVHDKNGWHFTICFCQSTSGINHTARIVQRRCMALRR